MFNDILYRLWGIFRIIREKFVLDIHIVEHCNLNCKSCVHFSPIAEKEFIDVKNLKKNLQTFKRRNIYKFFKEVHLLGGEPLLHPQISEVLKIIRIGFPLNKSKIKLITNGICLPTMNESFWEICKKNEIIISITQYPIPLNYNNIFNLCKAHKIQYESFENHIEVPFWQFKIKEKPPLFKDRKNFYGCYSHDAMQFKDDKLYLCPITAHSYHLNKRFGTDFKIKQKDYLSLKKINIINFWIFRLRPKPFCSYCIFPRNPIKWERSNFLPSEWVDP